MEATSYIVELPFKGHIETSFRNNAVFSFDSNKKITLNEYLLENKDKNLQVLSGEKVDKLFSEYQDSLITTPEKIELSKFHDMLEVLPPCNWHKVGGYQVFYMSEFYTGNITSWYAKDSYDNCYTFMQDAYLKDRDLINILKEIEK